jgi:hypothetical protein
MNFTGKSLWCGRCEETVDASSDGPSLVWYLCPKGHSFKDPDVRVKGQKEIKMKQEFYRQCTFRSGDTETTSWVPEKGVEVGGQVAFEGKPDEWWEVVSVGTSKITKQQAKGLERRNVQFQGSIK